MTEQTFYSRLAARFDQHQTVNGFTTITAEQVVSRLNEVLGYEGWSFVVKEHGTNTEADEIWVLGRMEVYRADEVTIIREQFGSSKIKRFNRGDNAGKPIDLGHDLMGAATTAMKKCASLIGVGLYLSAKGNSTGASRGTGGQNQSRQNATGTHPASNSSGQRAAGSTGAPTVCGECNAPLETVRVLLTDKDGTQFERDWSPADLEKWTRKRFNQPRCAECAGLA